MVLVIVGHQFQKQELTIPMQVIYSFHMPLMFIISGMFLKKEPVVIFVRKKVRRLLYPYFFCTAAMCIIESLKCALHKDDILKIILKDVFISLYGSGNGKGSYFVLGSYKLGTSDEIGMLWFLLALFWGSVVVRLCLNGKHPCFLILVVSSLAYFSSQIVWLPFSIQNGFACSAWIYLGYMASNRKWLMHIDKIHPLVKFAAGILWVISALWGCTHLYENYLRLGIIEVVGAVYASIKAYDLSIAISKNNIANKILTWIGRNTLLIYALHFLENRLFPMSRIVTFMSHSDNALAIACEASCMVLFVCICGTYILKRFKFTKAVF